MVTRISHSAAETERLGFEWGTKAAKGLVIGLSGDLGAGKTQLVKGIARGLGITAGVHSPTFALINIYEGGRLTLFHLDLYRLETPQEITSSGLEEYLTPDGITVIEWAERWFGEFPNAAGEAAVKERPTPCRWAKLEPIDATTRQISYEDFGA